MRCGWRYNKTLDGALILSLIKGRTPDLPSLLEPVVANTVKELSDLWLCHGNQMKSMEINGSSAVSKLFLGAVPQKVLPDLPGEPPR